MGEVILDPPEGSDRPPGDLRWLNGRELFLQTLAATRRFAAACHAAGEQQTHPDFDRASTAAGRALDELLSEASRRLMLLDEVTVWPALGHTRSPSYPQRPRQDPMTDPLIDVPIAESRAVNDST